MRTISSLILVTLAASASFSLCSAQTTQKHPAPHHSRPASSSTVPDDLFFNGVIYTGEGFADDKPRPVEAMAVGGSKVIAVGTTAEVSRLAGPKTRMHDLDTTHT